MPNRDKKIRYCSECGTIGNIPKGNRNCCPDPKPSRIPISVAVQAHTGIKASLALYLAPREFGKG